MTVARLLPILFGVSLLLLAAPESRALDDTGAQAVISRFLASQKGGQGEASPGPHAITDLDGDGKPDLVLLWDVMGPTSAYPKLTLFIDQGRNYRTLTTDLDGQTQKLTVNGSSIVVDTLVLGPRDPRCCPTVKKQLKFRWANGKLVTQN